MKRRSFLASLFGIPAAIKAAEAKPVAPEPVKFTEDPTPVYYGRLHPDELDDYPTGSTMSTSCTFSCDPSFYTAWRRER